MRPGKLYTKIFLSFILILIITEILIFGVFMVFIGKNYRDRFEEFTSAKVQIIKEMTEDKLDAMPDTAPGENRPLRHFIKSFSDLLGAKVWLATSDGTVLVQSFEGNIPDVVRKVHHVDVKVFGNIKLFKGHRKPFEFYGLVPVSLPQGGTGDLHVLFEKGGAREHEGVFTVGLLIIGIAVALLTYPVSRFITKRVKELRQSALQIAEGDISHRTKVGGKDEIGELARSFNRMADQLERMIRGGKELTANVSHELRSPLARIRIAAELLRERLQKADMEGWERHYNDIHEDIEELDRLIGRILDLSKLDLHDSPLKIEPFNLSKFIEDILERFKPALEQKSLHCKKKIDPGVSLSGEQEAMASALSNVIDNAVKFSPKDGTLTVRMSREETGINLSIANTHDPLPEKDLEAIFEPFQRSEGAQAKGTGLGLAITKRVIKNHGGRIRAKNSDEGFMIEIHLPFNSEPS